ncbi:vegetative cell wall protein gp1-like [Chrysoperla carnea]|uniref:vegetative cell wall protein gp1-like n=1 Tax=Chrysoperla carnea TaxID=189513 RepID=UPI001D07D96D|nr:vegetative cell wall protein gp1-like [Chrysoperla carnea]
MTEENTSIKKPAVDPGWNDPPMLSTPTVQPATKRNILNKRVAFPLFNGSGSPTTTDGTSISLNSTPTPPRPSPPQPLPNSANSPAPPLNPPSLPPQ